MTSQFDRLRELTHMFGRMDEYTKTNETLNDAVKKNIIDLDRMRAIQAELLEQQMSIAKTKREIYSSDHKGLNVFKKLQNISEKAIKQFENIDKIKKSIRGTDHKIYQLALQKDRLTNRINKFQSASANIEEKIKQSINSGNQELADKYKLQQQTLENKVDEYKKIKNILIDQSNLLILNNQINKQQLSQVQQTVVGFRSIYFTLNVIAKAALGVLGAIKGIAGFVKGILVNTLRKTFESFLKIQSVTGNLAADIGLTNTEAKFLQGNLNLLAISASKYGGTMENVAEIYKKYSEVTNRNRLFNERDIEQLMELSLGTELGVQGATELAGTFENIGISLDRTIKLTDKARNYAARFNVNSAKVLRTYKDLVDSLTGIGFRRGLDNMTKMAARAQAIRFDIEASTKSFIDSFFDLDKAMDASAQMQVLGGQFAASFGDPIQLAFESMNDPALLAQKFSELLKGRVVKKGTEFIISPQDRKMLKIAAESLGQDYEMIKQSTIEQAKIADKIAAMNRAATNTVYFDDDEKLAIASLMNLNEKGEYVIRNSDGVDVLLSNLTTKDQYQRILDSRKANEKAAIQRLNLMERLRLIVDRFNLGLSSFFQRIFGDGDFESFLQKVENASTKLSTFISNEILGNQGLMMTTSKLWESAQNVLNKILDIFGNFEGTFIQKLGKTLVVLFKDVLVELMDFMIPLIQASFGVILTQLKDIPLLGRAFERAGNDLQLRALQRENKNFLIEHIYNSDGSNDFQNQLLQRQDELSQINLLHGAGRGYGLYRTMKGVVNPATQVGFMGQLFAKALSGMGFEKSSNKLLNKNYSGLQGFNSFKSENSNKFGTGADVWKKGGVGHSAWANTVKSSQSAVAQNAVESIGKSANKAITTSAKSVTKTMTKKLPIIGGLIGLGLAAKDLLDGNYYKAGFGATSALMNIVGSGLIASGMGAPLGAALYTGSIGIDAGMMANDLGMFNDGVIYKDGSYAKFSKGDMVQFIDQDSMERERNRKSPLLNMQQSLDLNIFNKLFNFIGESFNNFTNKIDDLLSVNTKILSGVNNTDFNLDIDYGIFNKLSEDIKNNKILDKPQSLDLSNNFKDIEFKHDVNLLSDISLNFDKFDEKVLDITKIFKDIEFKHDVNLLSDISLNFDKFDEKVIDITKIFKDIEFKHDVNLLSDISLNFDEFDKKIQPLVDKFNFTPLINEISKVKLNVEPVEFKTQANDYSNLSRVKLDDIMNDIVINVVNSEPVKVKSEPEKVVTNTVNHTGTIIIKTDDGKVVTWDQLYSSAGFIGQSINASKAREDNGYGHNLHPNINSIKPLT